MKDLSYEEFRKIIRNYRLGCDYAGPRYYYCPICGHDHFAGDRSFNYEWVERAIKHLYGLLK